MCGVASSTTDKSHGPAGQVHARPAISPTLCEIHHPQLAGIVVHLITLLFYLTFLYWHESCISVAVETQSNTGVHQ
jgi:hypothetical protein